MSPNETLGPLRLFQSEGEAFHDFVHKKLGARIIDLTFRCLTRFRFHLHGDVFANADVADVRQTNVGHVVAHSLPLGSNKAGSGMMSMAARNFMCNECVKGESQWGLA